MNYSNEFLARVYGAYMGCGIKHQSASVGYVGKQRVGVMLSICSYTTEILVGGYGHGNNDLATIATSKLLLTPLSQISDEDAIELARIVGFNRDLLAHGQEFALYLDEGKKISEFSDQLTHAIDYLRSKGYDCGYGEIPSLIDDGIAIDKTKTI